MDRRALLTTAVALATTAACTKERGSTSAPPSGSAPATTVPSPRTSSSPPQGSRPSPSPARDLRALGRGLEGRLVLPDDADYPTARQLYNTRFDSLRPAAVAYVSGPADVQECLRYARAHRVPISVRSGGHSYAGHSSGDGRLVIDVSPLDRVTADGSDAATIGAGARLVSVYRALGARGRTLPAGSCASVGVSGLALGGGHGVTSRAYGLTCDSLTGATVVTADGQVRRIGADRDGDLFWALRGAGHGSFGVVTELRFRTHPAPPLVVAQLSWPWRKAAAVLTAWQRWGPDQPDETWSAAHLTAGSAGGAAPRLSVAVCSFGTEGTVRNAVDRLADAAGSSASSVSLRTRPHLAAMLGYAGCSTRSAEECALPGAVPGRSRAGALGRETYAAASDFFDREVSAAAVRELIARTERFTRLPAGRGEGSIQLTALGGAVNRVDPLATSFVHRRSRVLVQYLASWAQGTAGAAERSWLRDAHGAMRGHVSGAAYQNYADATLSGWRTAYFGPAADRLGRLRRQYDPEGVFAFPQSL
ncbi:FAD-binding oxidoreductase [Streptomyces sp. NPDC020412]|uniref:FAD-binding oxidoreductase n=1 Tax=Streptomyces sp. NPDC020412 TaxID=3365073 RepID=UPI0037B6F737